MKNTKMGIGKPVYQIKTVAVRHFRSNIKNSYKVICDSGMCPKRQKSPGKLHLTIVNRGGFGSWGRGQMMLLFSVT
jgi:hypothetical protein